MPVNVYEGAGKWWTIYWFVAPDRNKNLILFANENRPNVTPYIVEKYKIPTRESRFFDARGAQVKAWNWRSKEDREQNGPDMILSLLGYGGPQARKIRRMSRTLHESFIEHMEDQEKVWLIKKSGIEPVDKRKLALTQAMLDAEEARIERIKRIGMPVSQRAKRKKSTILDRAMKMVKE